MELKVDVSRSRCRAFWDRSRLEKALGPWGMDAWDLANLVRRSDHPSPRASERDG